MSVSNRDSSNEKSIDELEQVWFEILGASADTTQGFVANGGDSLKAVAFTQMVHDQTGLSLDLFDVLTALSLDDLRAQPLEGIQ